MGKQLSSLLAAAMVSVVSPVAQADPIIVGGKNFTEQLILADMTVQLLDAKGYEVEERSGMGSSVLRHAQENGQVDLYWEYTGTSLIAYNEVNASLSREATYERVKQLDSEKGLVWLEPSGANNTYALAMREDDAEERGVTSISDLADAINSGSELKFASNTIFYSRSDGLRPMQEAYGFEFGRRNVKRMDAGLVYEALRDGEVEVGLVFATDGRIPAFDFRVLEDDQNHFPDYALTPVVREEILEANPELSEQMNSLSGLLDDQEMAVLNSRVDVERETIEHVAEDFLEEHDLL